MPPIDPILVNGEPLAICWGSNSPRVSFSYGATTALVVPTLRDQLGCRMSISATYGESAGKINWHGITTYPHGKLPHGNDIHAAHARQEQAHILLTHQDVPWQIPEMITRGGTRWVSWAPIDHTPLSPKITSRINSEYCYQPIAVSRFGAETARAAGIDIRCIPQGVKTRAYGDARLDALLPPYVPGSKSDARRALGWPEDAFIVGMVAANSGYPDRKAFHQNLSAFHQLAEQHSDAMIYIHAYGDDQADDRVSLRLGWSLGDDLLDSGRVRWAHPYDLITQGYSVADMVTRYQAFDVLLSVSMAEGFGLPIIEAQACGVPAIVGDWSAMSEILFAGWRVREEESRPWPVPNYESYWRLPDVDAIAHRLELAYETPADVRREMATHAREQVVEHHDQAHLTDTAWRPVLTELAQRIEAEPVPWHVHRWAGYGHTTADGVLVPCLVDGCPAESSSGPNGRRIHRTGAPITIAGITLTIEDDPRGGVARTVAAEVVQTYHLDTLELPPGAVIIDVGAHVGVVSCYLSRRFPLARIYAYEPVPANFARLVRNLDANDCGNVQCSPHAITADGRTLALAGDPDTNTGGYSAWGAGTVVVEDVLSRRLVDILDEEHIDRVDLLKLDCEGAEYEILESLRCLGIRVQQVIVEIHRNAAIEAAIQAKYGTSAALLMARTPGWVPTVRASVITIPDAEEVAAI